MLSTRQIEKHLQFTSPELRDIVMELRGLVGSIVPTATEAFHRQGLTYYVAERGGPVSAGICQINLQPDHVRLAFIHGAFLPDPKHLLEGAPKYKRYVKVCSFDQAPWDDLQALIEASSHFDPYTLTMR